MFDPYYQQPAPPPTPVLAKPATDCDNCGGFVQVGQRITIVIDGVMDYDPSSGYGVVLDPNGGRVLAYFRMEREQIDNPVLHAECSAEYCHDHITQEECGNAYCAACNAKLSGD